MAVVVGKLYKVSNYLLDFFHSRGWRPESYMISKIVLCVGVDVRNDGIVMVKYLIGEIFRYVEEPVFHQCFDLVEEEI